jgi:hypothetical protein
MLFTRIFYSFMALSMLMWDWARYLTFTYLVLLFVYLKGSLSGLSEKGRSQGI